MKIYKYEIPLEDKFTIALPREHKILSFQSQNDSLFIWCLVNPELSLVKEVFFIVGTGVAFNNTGKEYIGTVQDGIFVWHLFKEENFI